MSREFSNQASHHHQQRYSLVAERQYYIELQHTSRDEDSSVALAMRLYSTQ